MEIVVVDLFFINGAITQFKQIYGISSLGNKIRISQYVRKFCNSVYNFCTGKPTTLK